MPLTKPCQSLGAEPAHDSEGQDKSELFCLIHANYDQRVLAQRRGYISTPGGDPGKRLEKGAYRGHFDRAPLLANEVRSRVKVDGIAGNRSMRSAARDLLAPCQDHRRQVADRP